MQFLPFSAECSLPQIALGGKGEPCHLIYNNIPRITTLYYSRRSSCLTPWYSGHEVFSDPLHCRQIHEVTLPGADPACVLVGVATALATSGAVAWLDVPGPDRRAGGAYRGEYAE